MTGTFRLHFDPEAPVAAGPADTTFQFRVISGAASAVVGRLGISLTGGDPAGSFMFKPSTEEGSWGGSWRAEDGAVVIETLTVEYYPGVTKEHVRSLPLALVPQAVAQLVGGDAHALIAEAGDGLFFGQLDRVEALRRSLSGARSALDAARPGSGRGRPSTSDSQKRGWALSVAALCDAPKTSRADRLYETLGEQWGKREGRHSAVPAATVRTRVRGLVDEHWLVKTARATYALGAKYQETLGEPL